MSRRYRGQRYGERRSQRRSGQPRRQVTSAPVAAPAPASSPSPSSSSAVPSSARSYDYVAGELRRIGMLMGGIIVILIVLAVILR